MISQYNAGSGRPIGLAVAYLGPGLQGIFRMRMYQYQRLERARPSFFPVAINNRASPCFSRCYWIGLRSGHTVWFLHQNTTLEMSCTIILMKWVLHHNSHAPITFLCKNCLLHQVIASAFECNQHISLQQMQLPQNYSQQLHQPE